ncbi:hypothetical protein BDV25DRAFT_69828 [Aspergillus avenaceus]|uniref:Uncharacterized protein n=1 Tax=Aspergillus avenaceus TaxID=36643 RepID=A0A5N6TGH9_ASPAV|nr:hypothetical protein BDV25DRAFT_69828 [Aspergillus avenaceus]
MLGFMGSMTEEFEQRGLNLRDTASSLNDGCDGGDHGVLEKGALPNIDEAICTVDEGPGPGALDVYERQLLAQFGEMDAPPTIFGSITLEWKYVRSVILSQARESAPLLNAVYCYSEVFMGHKRRLASVYHQRASSEIQACELENVSDILLKQVFAAVFLLMLAEVCISQFY